MIGWSQLATTKLRAVSPINGFGGSSYQFRTEVQGLVFAFSGGTYDTLRHRLLIWGGGHADYYGNEMYALYLTNGVLLRLTDPSLPVADNTEGLAGNTAPNSRHTYDGITYMDHLDKVLTVSGALAGAGNVSNGWWLFACATNAWTQITPTGTLPSMRNGMLVKYDPVSQLVFIQDELNLFKYNPDTNVCTLVATGTTVDYHLTSAIDPVLRKMVMIGGGQAWIVDITGPTYSRVALSTTGGSAIVNAVSPGIAYNTARGTFGCWADGNDFYELDISTGTGVFTATTFANGPTARATGTFGHWQYSELANAFVTISNADIDIAMLQVDFDSPTNYVQLISTSSGTVPFTVAVPVKDSDIASGSSPTVNLANYQSKIKRVWNSGCPKHAVLSGRLTLTANVPTTLIVSAGTAPSGTALTAANIATAAPSASIQCGAIGTVNLSSLLASPFRTYTAGAEMVECHYTAAVGADATLRAWFHVRLYADGRMWLRLIADNGVLNSNTDKNYVPTFIINGVTVYSHGGTSLAHYAHTRYCAEGWIGGDPAITPRHNTFYLMDAGFVPFYHWTNPSASALNALTQTYVQMGKADWSQSMGDEGFQIQIGLLALWDALYITSGADSRAYNSVLTNAKALNSYGIIWNDQSTNLPILPSDRPTWTVEGAGGGGSNDTVAGSLTWERAHHGSGGYLAYLLTGDYFYLETMLHQCATFYLVYASSKGSGVNRIFDGQTRARGWMYRTYSQYCGIAPIDATLTDYQSLLTSQVNTDKAVVDTLGGVGLGYVYDDMVAYGNGLIAPWQQHFYIQSVGHGSDLEPLSTMTNYLTVRAFLYKAVVGIFGDSSGYCFTRASVYNAKICATANTNPTAWFTDWKSVETATHGVVGCSNTLLGSSGSDPANAPTGYWGNALPALSYATRHGATGAAAAFARLLGASNWPTVESSGFDDTPIFGVYPLKADPPPPPPAVTAINVRQIW